MGRPAGTFEIGVVSHCVHCGSVMPYELNKTIDVYDSYEHSLITPCDCLSRAEIERLQAEVEQLRKDGAAVASAGAATAGALASAEAKLERVVTAIPTNWLDPLLTGKDKVIDSDNSAQDIQRLLPALKKRIVAIVEDKANDS